MAKSYIEESIEKKKVCRMIMGEKTVELSTNIISLNFTKATTIKESNTIPMSSGIKFVDESFKGA